MLAVEMLSEPVDVPDTLVSGPSHIEDMGSGQYRLTYYVRRQSPYGGDEFIVKVRLVMSGEAVLADTRMRMEALGVRCCGAVAGRDKRH